MSRPVPGPERTGAEPAGPIVVPLDGSSAALAVLPIARAIARLTRAPLRVLLVAESLLEMPDLPHYLGLNSQDAGELIFEQALGPQAEVAAIIERSAEAVGCALIALTTHGLAAPPPGEPLGPVARDLLRQIQRPLLFVRPGAPGMDWPQGAPVRALLPLLDGRLTACSARWGTDLVALAQAELLVLILASLPEPTKHRELALPRYVDQPSHEWPAWAREFWNRFCELLGSCPAVPRRLVIEPGDPAAMTLAVARERDVDLIALVHPASTAPGLTEAILADAPCPVLVLPHAPPA